MIPKLSASSLKTLSECSMKFFLSYFERLPEKVWPKTHAGTVVHSILECLRRDRHRAHREAVLANRDIYATPALRRFIVAWVRKTQMAPEIAADLNDMSLLAMERTNYLDLGAVRTFAPEHEFRMTLANGAPLKGYIDRLAFYGGTTEAPERAVITDFKSQGKRFTQADLDNNLQALVYQLYVWRTFQLPAAVEFIMLRHLPTSRTPEKHIQRVPAATPSQLAGFEAYLQHMWTIFQGFDFRAAHTKWHKDEGFCLRVCSYRLPFDYQHVAKRDGTLVGNFPLDKPRQVGEDEVSETRHHAGCPRFNS